MLKLHWKICVLSSLFLVVFSKPDGPLAKDIELPPAASATMNRFLESFLDLQGFIVSKEPVNSSADRKKIAADLKKLAGLAKDLKNIHTFETTTFQISADLLYEQLISASRAFSSGNVNFARRNLRSTLDACSSCHAQVQNGRDGGWKFDENLLKGSTFQRAEFLFATRQYGPAVRLYQNFARNFIADQSVIELELALTHLLAIHLRIHRDLAAAKKELLSIQNHPHYPNAIKMKIAGWIRELNVLENFSVPNPEKVSAKTLLSFTSSKLGASEARNYADEPQVVRALFLSGLLYEFVNKRPERDVTPEILYWLALYENRLGENYPIELSHLYLKECVIRFSNSETAKLCYNEYESLVTLDYTGSSGTDLPSDVVKELQDLKAKLKD